ncbi:hypothetical protein F383_27276 [Gossypium arboreum]|uniref:Uncharacterized protein n=1 Tax=Gossypium arboreum TaxID=29729 RepID=A0A0B0MHQ4_GOSAR|nr:hypothetical protein F383_38084 [Gossypium arboreum]KHG21592.1 hypothetical protein F383_27276 [Gossypium arboreum]
MLASTYYLRVRPRSGRWHHI